MEGRKPGQYWSFYWPLALTGLAMLLTRQFQNGVLARYPEAAQELAVFAYATSIFFLFHAALGFVPQMTNALVRSEVSARVCLRFLLGLCAVGSLCMAGIAFLPPGRLFVSHLFDIRGEVLDAVMLYLRILSPLMIINGLRQYQVGLLVQAKRTGVVTLLNAGFLVAVLSILLAGFFLGWRAVHTLAFARVAGSALHLGLSWFFRRRLVRLPGAEPPGRPLSYGQVLSFFWPVALTSTMFALSRPILYTFVSRTPDAVTTVAALRVAFDFSMIFHMPLNQFRHLFVTFGEIDLDGVRRFMMKVVSVMSLSMIFLAATPVSGLFLEGLLGVEEHLADIARQGILVLCLVPLIVTLRNYYHGLCLVRRKTVSMGVGALFRNGAIYLSAWGFFHAGWLGSVPIAALVLVLGFAAETAVVLAAHLLGAVKADEDLPATVAAEEEPEAFE